MPRARTTIRAAAVATATGLALSLAAALPAAADTVPSPGYPVEESALTPFLGQEIVWAECPEPELVAADLECTEFEVPLDYGDPDGARLTIAASRAAATDPEERLGLLLINPGGPGGPARHMPAALSGTSAHGVYDLIGMDPRGTGASSPLDCGVEFPMIRPRASDAEISTDTREKIRYARACDAAEGDRFPHMTTANTARDMDVLRAASGEERINYLGYSYGTYLGPVYGSLFPERLDRSVLDSSIHPDGVWRDVFLGQAPAGTANMERYTEWLAEHDDVYGFGTDPEGIVALFDETSARLDEEPRDDVPNVELVDGATFDLLAFSASRDQGYWDVNSWFLRLLVDGEPVPGEEFEQPEMDPVFDMSMDLFSAVVCEAEWPDRLGLYHQQSREYRDAHPYGTGALWTAPQACTFTRNAPTEKPVELVRDGYPETLVIAADHDANTFYEGGPVMAERLESPLLTVTDEGGHGFYLMRDPYTGELGHPCVNAVVDSYLIDGVVPEDTECGGIPRPGSPEVSTFDGDPGLLLTDVERPNEWLLPTAPR
ncbi:alpha/beta fold hydrolase [Nocardiopsis prasina]|uniref:alpha/beta fold hydrolase n=1 Tax=Nocardiopsis prasina TaxID=2015 RepID=UPI00034C1863|nr:alpha/beta fold hydrolase [Nocardiopsis prasina]